VEVAQSVQSSLEVSVSYHLAEIRRAVLLLRESILAETPFGPANLADQAVEASIAFLAEGVTATQLRSEQADSRGIETVGAKTKKNDIVARWGRS
jgi:hypothetical protein